ncbi:thymocyte nuclear protein 1 isoform X2 [Vulpes vulpes]|uniref:Thymocyte nuclear protein 1 n=1 Tax=Vulpes vulpes TaxID=9627 RepID=A0A3Q7SH87_VULVU|nr:thymocyte nuclear protein 1 isoform X2 [Vulpes vulpes]
MTTAFQREFQDHKCFMTLSHKSYNLPPRPVSPEEAARALSAPALAIRHPAPGQSAPRPPRPPQGGEESAWGLRGQEAPPRTSAHDSKRPAGKRTKTRKPTGTSARVGDSSPEKTSASKNCGNNQSSYWLMKSEPQSRIEKGVDVKARNFLRAMKLEQKAFFYHSNCKEPGIAGLVKIVKEAYPDHTQFEKNNPYYDPSSKEDNPKWSMVDVQFVRLMKRYITLTELKANHQAHKATGGPLKNMALFTHPRLSVQPLTPEEFEFILSLEEKEPS